MYCATTLSCGAKLGAAGAGVCAWPPLVVVMNTFPQTRMLLEAAVG